MRLLSFESSAKTASVALTNGNRLIAQYTQSGGLTHSTTLLPMAKTLLSDTDIYIRDIAFRCGFENEYYFSNFFKKHTSYSPSAFRKLSKLK